MENDDDKNVNFHLFLLTHLFLVFKKKEREKKNCIWVSQRWSMVCKCMDILYVDNSSQCLHTHNEMKWSGFTLIGCLGTKKRNRVKNKRQLSERKRWVPGLFISTQQASSLLWILCSFSFSFNVYTYNISCCAVNFFYDFGCKFNIFINFSFLYTFFALPSSSPTHNEISLFIVTQSWWWNCVGCFVN